MDTHADFAPIDPFDHDAAAQLRAGLQALREGLSALIPAGTLEGARDELLLTSLHEFAHLARDVEALQVQAGRELSQLDEGPREDTVSWRHGAKNVNELVRRHTLESRGLVARRLRVAAETTVRRSLTGEPLPARFDTVRQALDEGWINTEHAHVIITEISRLPEHTPPHMREGAERFFTAIAAGLPTPPRIHEYTLNELIVMRADENLDADTSPGLPADPDTLRRHAAAWRHVFDPDGVAPAEERMKRLYLRFTTLESGNVRFQGETTAAHAALWKQQLDAINSPKSMNGLTPEEAPQEQPPPEQMPLEQPLSREQRDHDAFIAILTHAITAGGLPRSGGAPITVLTVVNDRRCDGGCDQQSGERGDAPTAWVVTPLSDPVPVDQPTLERWGSTGVLQRLRLDRGGAVLSLTTHSRGFTNSQRKAISVRDGTCVIPGCHISAFWCEMNHVVPWRDGGPTSVENGVALCFRHHATIDHSGWEIEMRGGWPWVRPPSTLDLTRRWQPHKNPLLG